MLEHLVSLSNVQNSSEFIQLSAQYRAMNAGKCKQASLLYAVIKLCLPSLVLPAFSAMRMLPDFTQAEQDAAHNLITGSGCFKP